MNLGLPEGDNNVYNIATYPEAIVFLGIVILIAWSLWLVYLAARPFLEARAKCHKCPEEDET